MLPHPLSIGAILYSPDHAPEALLETFALALRERGFSIGGLIQKTQPGEDGCKCRMDLIELDTGRQVALSQDLGSGSSSCALDPSALTEASGALRRAVALPVDLLFVNKFSKSEKSGGGLAAEMLAAMAAGVSVLTAVPAALVEDWTAFTGGRGQLLMPTPETLWRWWGALRLQDDLVLGVPPEHKARRVVIGMHWVLVEGPLGIGLAQTPERETSACKPATQGWAGQSLAALAGLIRSWDPLESAIGVAALNAHYNRFDLPADDVNGLDALAFDPAARTVSIGAFPSLTARLPQCAIIDRRLGAGHYPEEAVEWLLPAAEAVLITSSTLANRTLPRLLRLIEGTPPTALVGPSAPLTERLFSYGITLASGLIATDPEGLIRAVAEGGGTRDIKRYCRQATVRVQP